MGSVCTEDESSPHCKKCKSWEKILGDSVAVDNALVLRKPRSAMKKRARGNIVLPWSISRKKRRVWNGIKRPCVKKSKLIMKQGEISKDEEEVVETLNSLAEMFSNTVETNKPVLDDEPSIIKSSTEDSVILNVQEESEKVNTSNHSSTEFLISSARGSNIGSFVFPTWSENTSSVVQHSYIPNKIQHPPQVVVETNKTRKRCSTHVHIARLIKDLHKTETLKGLAPWPTQLTISRGVDLRQYHTSSGYQMRRINGSNEQQTFPILPSLKQARQRWPAHGGFPIPHLPEWQTRGRDYASLFNEAQARFPHFVNSSSSFSNTERRAFDRNGGVLYSDNMQLRL